MTSSLSCEVLDSQGNALPSLYHNAQRYIIADAGLEFTVRVKLHNTTGKDHKVRLSIDGQDVGYSKIFYGDCRHNEGTFVGFLQHQGANNANSLYKAFKFGACKPAEDAAVVQHLDEIKAGRIDIECDTVVATGHSRPTTNKPVVVGNEAAKKKLPEGKKWFLAPGLKAEAGKTVSISQKWNYTVYTPVSSLPPLRLRYDTADNLILRKILNMSNPAHRALLQNSKNPRLARMAADPDEATSPAIRSVPGSSRQQVKKEGAVAGVKRERDDAVPRSATAEKLDLTGAMPTGPLLVNGRAVGVDETAVCDLCDSDDEPTWQVQKKQALELEAEL